MALWHFNCIVFPGASRELLRGREIASIDEDLWGAVHADAVLAHLRPLGSPHASWSEDIILWGDIDETSVQLASHARLVEEVRVCIDMRMPNEYLVGLFLRIAEANGWILYSEDCELLGARMDDVLKAAYRSRAARFSEDPRKYISDVALQASIGNRGTMENSETSGEVEGESPRELDDQLQILK